MMETKELRIGNWVRFTDKNEEFQIGCISHNEIEMGFVLLSEVEPIPLTEEWLIKFGFEKQNEWWFKNHKLSIEKWITKEGIGVRLRTSEESSVLITEIQHVHQLQNLYYALTGDELHPLK